MKQTTVILICCFLFACSGESAEKQIVTIDWKIDGTYLISSEAFSEPFLLGIQFQDEAYFIQTAAYPERGEQADWNIHFNPFKAASEDTVIAELKFPQHAVLHLSANTKNWKLEIDSDFPASSVEKIVLGDLYTLINSTDSENLETAESGDESLSFADYELSRLYASITSNGSRRTNYVFIGDIMLFEGQGALIGSKSDGSQCDFFIDLANMHLVSDLLDEELVIKNEYILKPFVVQTVSKSIEDVRGEIVDEDYVVELFQYNEDLFKTNGVDHADKIYELADELRELIRLGDSLTIIEHIDYPYIITEPESGHQWTFTNPTEVELHQNDIFNNKVLTSILDLDYQDIQMEKGMLFIGSFTFELQAGSGDEFRFIGIDPF